MKFNLSEKSIIDSLSSNIAILDEKGFILMTNRAWQDFAIKNGYIGRPDSVGVNYLKIAESATGPFAEGTKEVVDGLLKVIHGEIDEFVTDYPCHSPDKKRWFILRTVPLKSKPPRKIIVSHEDITKVKIVEEKIRESERLIREQKSELEELNTALKVMIKQREAEKELLEQTVISNIRELVMPFIQRLKVSGLRKEQITILEIIERHINEISKSLLTKFRTSSISLTPMEVRVASLIRDGLISKEISETLNISKSAVDFHRKNLRKKFGLTNTKKSLRSYLMSLL